MPAPSPERRGAALVEWLVREARELPSMAAVIGGFARRLTQGGVPFQRLFVNTRTLHPQLATVDYVWRQGDQDAREAPRPHGILEAAIYLDSPIKRVFDSGEEVRRRLAAPGSPDDFPILADLRAQGATDYIAVPIRLSQGRMNVLTLAADRPGGFADADLALVRLALPYLALVLEIKETRRMAAALLETYLGRDAGRRVLGGLVKRGDVVSLAAALWYCDLRNFTAMSERQERGEIIATLNDYFACMAEPVHAHGGEVLKFIGDAMLAIFPIADDLDRDRACRAALDAAEDALGAFDSLNARRRAGGLEVLELGLALHTGSVTYGNIGAPDRLDFTVIGPAVNMVNRLERLCQKLGRRLLTSARFASPCGSKLVPLGRHVLRGIAEPQEIFGLPEES
jgi:adenylate cyclase